MLKKLLVIISVIIATGFSLNMLTACSNTEPYVLKSLYVNEDTLIQIDELKQSIKDLEDPELIKSTCDENKLKRSCFVYALYLDMDLQKPRQAYDYYKKAFDLGEKQAGYYIGGYQLNHPEWFDEFEQITKDEIAFYLKESLKSGNNAATSILAMLYGNKKYNYIDYEKSEYYAKKLIEQNTMRGSRILLASLYTLEMQDKSKIDTSIQLYYDDLILERNLLSAMALADIYRNPKDYGAEIDPIKALAYGYVARDLRKEEPNNTIPKAEEELIQEMEAIFTPEDRQKAKAVYQQIKMEMDAAQEK